jgi:hypothetical protein
MQFTFLPTLIKWVKLQLLTNNCENCIRKVKKLTNVVQHVRACLMLARSSWCLHHVQKRQLHVDGITIIFHFCGKRIKNIDLWLSSSIMQGCMAHPWSILGKLEARLIKNSNVWKDLSPHKLSNILKNLLNVVKWRAINLLTVLLTVLLPNSCICLLSAFGHINCIGGVFVLLSS